MAHANQEPGWTPLALAELRASSHALAKRGGWCLEALACEFGTSAHDVDPALWALSGVGPLVASDRLIAEAKR